VSVGNLTVGGTGKTPLVVWLVEQAIAMGRRPGVLARGYGRAEGAELNDEGMLLAERFPDLPQVQDPDRVAGGRRLVAEYDVDLVILDDGFQHRRLHRDLDIVLIDATRDTLRDRLLPRGFLREPVANLRRADAVVVTRATSVDADLAARVEQLHGHPPVAWARHTWASLRLAGPDEPDAFAEVDWLRGKRVVTMLGVANPAPILEQVEQAGADVACTIPARDHERYERQKLLVARGLCEGADALLMTGKDWVKARHLIDLPDWPVPIVVPWLEIDVFEGAGALKDLILGTLSAA